MYPYLTISCDPPVIAQVVADRVFRRRGSVWGDIIFIGVNFVLFNLRSVSGRVRFPYGQFYFGGSFFWAGRRPRIRGRLLAWRAPVFGYLAFWQKSVLAYVDVRRPL